MPRSRKEIQIAVDFLMTRVWELDKDDLRKLHWVLQYLRGTIYIPIILIYEILNVIKRCVDASYIVHEDMRATLVPP